MSTMQAILIKSFVSDPSTLKPTQIPIPQPTANEYLVRVTHCGPQHADILHAQGTHQNVHAKKGNVHPPFVPGYDFAGIIEQAPDNATLQRGDRVFGAGIGAFAGPTGPGYQVPLAQAVKQALPEDAFVTAVGVITDPTQAEHIVVTGQADGVSIARAALGNPQWPNHAAQQLGAQKSHPPQYWRGRW